VTWYLALCVQCNGGLGLIVAHPDQTTPMPFSESAARTSWVNDHMSGTGHSVLLMNQPDTATAAKDKTHDAAG